MATKKDLQFYVNDLNNKYFKNSKNHLVINQSYGGYMVGITGKYKKNKKMRYKWTSSGLKPVGNDYHDTATNTIRALRNYDDKGYLKKAVSLSNREVRLRSKYKSYYV